MSISSKQAKIFGGLVVVAGIVSSAAGYMKTKLEDRIFDLELSQSSIKAMEEHQKSVEALGPPFKIRRPNLRNIFNNITNTDATIAIPVAGEKTGGNLLIVASKKETDVDWTINSLKLEIPKHKIVIKE